MPAWFREDTRVCEWMSMAHGMPSVRRTVQELSGSENLGQLFTACETHAPGRCEHKNKKWAHTHSHTHTQPHTHTHTHAANA